MIRVGLVYLIAAWLTIQVAQTTFPALLLQLAIYKYTIVADGCDPETQANDPGIRVNK